jgi:uncharacterized membrane protein (UPF0127 family)
MKKSLAFAAALLACAAFAQEEPQMNLPRVKLAAGMHVIDAQVASTPDQRATGLMHRKEMPQHEGMLFVFEGPSQQCFWMKNTLLPLSVAFVADDGTIVNTGAAGTPLTTADKALLTVDVWEHAYYIDYRNLRPKFVETYLDKLVNWDFAAKNFA